jgi:hypothetical protein
MDDPKEKGAQDRSKIGMHEDFKVRYWTKALGVSKEPSQKAVDEVGNSAAAVSREFGCLTASFATLLEESVEIAWSYLQRTGEIEHDWWAIGFLTTDISAQLRRGERNRLLLANRAIRAYQRHKADHTFELVRQSG